jgi:mono/diheme cytochrome c family protein
MRNLKIGLIALALVLLGIYGYATYRDGQSRLDHGAADGPLVLAGSVVERGRYLAAAADCVACHTVPGGDEYAGGVAFTLPFGTLYSSNLTADADTGLGGWTDDEFVAAVRAGIARGGRHLYPAHPYTTYAGMARNDVLAIKAYLDSLPAVRNAVPSAQLSFPYSQRGLLPLWNALYQPAVGYQADPAHDATWNRGSYLANALGHCGECHTSRNFAYALKPGAALAGAVTRGWKAYNITPAGLAGWTAEALEAYLATGRAPDHGLAAGPMKEVVANDTAQLTVEDRRALVHFLLGARPSPVKPGVVVQGVAAAGSVGANLYAGACAGCHELDPRSAGAAIADLSGASSVRDPDGTNVLRLLAEGSPHGGEAGLGMPAFAPAYSHAERAALANYVLAQWGGLTPKLTANDARAATLP